MKKLNLPKEKLLKMYEDMVRIRKFETKISDDCDPKVLFGNYHTYIGQEATAVGACYAIDKTDYIVSTHRGHGHCIAKGARTDIMMAELLGRAIGYCKGRGGSLHVADVSLGILGANGIVGGGIPIAAGSALASKIMNCKEVTLSFFGEGASNEGTFHESVNMAALWKLPVVFVCENNQWGVTTPVEEVLNTEGVAERAKGYDIPGIRVDGNNVITVYETVKEAVEFARKGNGPTIVECLTFRMRAHNSSMDETREQELIAKWYKKDPILYMKNYLMGVGFKETEINGIDKKIDFEIEEAYNFAVSSPFPDIFDLTQNVYTKDNERSVAR